MAACFGVPSFGETVWQHGLVAHLAAFFRVLFLVLAEVSLIQLACSSGGEGTWSFFLINNWVSPLLLLLLLVSTLVSLFRRNEGRVELFIIRITDSRTIQFLTLHQFLAVNSSLAFHSLLESQVLLSNCLVPGLLRVQFPDCAWVADLLDCFRFLWRVG